MKKLCYLFIFISVITFGQKTEIDAKVTMNDGNVINTKIPFSVNMFDLNQINELSVSDKKVTLLEDGKKVRYAASDIQKIEFTDLKNKERVFVHAFDYQKFLIEQLYDGKIKWYRSYRANSYDGSVQSADILFKNGIRQVLSLLVNNRKKLKALMADKPELEPIIEKINYNKLKDENLLEILKKYDE